MRQLKRVIALALMLFLTLSLVPQVMTLAANGKGYPGDKAKLQITVENAISLSGTVEVSDPNQIVESFDCAVVERGKLKGGSVTGKDVFLYSTEAKSTGSDVTLEITVNLRKDAKAGSQATFTFTYVRSTDPTGMVAEAEVSKSSVVTVESKPVETTPSTEPTSPTESTQPTKPNTNTNTNTNTNNGSSNNKPNNGSGNSSNNNSNNSGSNNSSKPSGSTGSTEPKTNYEELNRQLDIAKGLNKNDYDDAVWAEFTKALEQAEKMTDSKNQADVDAATKALSQAITKLVGVDRSRLRAAIDKVSEYSQNLPLSSLWYQLIDVLENAEELVGSSDQAAMDEAAEQIENLLAEIAKAEKEAGPGIIVQEVPVEVIPTDDYCNVSVHGLWPVLFYLSLLVNLMLVILVIVYLLRMNGAQKDEIPLVDYDIDDDLDMDMDLDMEYEDDPDMDYSMSYAYAYNADYSTDYPMDFGEDYGADYDTVGDMDMDLEMEMELDLEDELDRVDFYGPDDMVEFKEDMDLELIDLDDLNLEDDQDDDLYDLELSEEDLNSIMMGMDQI